MNISPPRKGRGFLEGKYMNIELRPWDMSMTEALQHICNHVDRTYLTNRMPHPYTQDDAEWYLNRIAGHDGTDGLWRAIVVDGIVCGNISIEQKADVFACDCEIGYTLLDEYKGQGVMTEAVRKMCALAFQKLKVIRITGLADAPNLASRRVLEKNGFAFEGLMKNAVCKDGNIRDLVFYGKLKEEHE